MQEITLWRKGERVRKLPLAGSLYQQQQHALARHVAGDLPTEGVRTAPTPSLPPTPCLGEGLGESRLPGSDSEAVAPSSGEEQEGAAATSNSNILPSSAEATVAASETDHVATKTASSSQANGDSGNHQPMSAGAMAPPDLVSGTRDLSLTDLETDTDSTKDLDVVSVGGGGGLIAGATAATTTTPPEMLDSPPEMPSTPPEMLGGEEEEEEEVDSSVNNHSTASDELDLPDAPVSEPGSPQVGRIVLFFHFFVYLDYRPSFVIKLLFSVSRIKTICRLRIRLFSVVPGLDLNFPWRFKN